MKRVRIWLIDAEFYNQVPYSFCFALLELAYVSTSVQPVRRFAFTFPGFGKKSDSSYLTAQENAGCREFQAFYYHSAANEIAAFSDKNVNNEAQAKKRENRKLHPAFSKLSRNITELDCIFFYSTLTLALLVLIQ